MEKLEDCWFEEAEDALRDFMQAYFVAYFEYLDKLIHREVKNVR